MTDLTTMFTVMDGGDLQLGAIDLTIDDGLYTSVALSLFTDQRLPDALTVNDGTDHRRGWWADAYADAPGDQIGSLLWTLAREKRTESTRQRARDYARASLSWLIDDGVASAVEVDAQWLGTEGIGLDIQIHRAAAPAVRYRFDHFWNPINAV